jgi:hypothetical protein
VSAPPTRTLVIDENLNKRLATELSFRGRDATSVSALGLKGSSDPQLLLKLDDQLDDWVLVTADDALPGDHAGELEAVSGTVATIDPDRLDSWHLEMWRREIVHRWAHAMHAQDSGTARRYGLLRHGAWRPRRRRRR